ncbi:aminotransferase class V-fold PLP-dependent enzyme [bacterium]|nr:aminotransferase class V-fold PLP-dependent enzyme [bacterium]
MKVYFDNNATTQVAPEVIEALLPYYGQVFGNASSFHQFGKASAEALLTAREQVARFFNADVGEIVFTGSGSESDNYVLKGLAARAEEGHMIVSPIEHPAVLRTARYLAKKLNIELTELRVDSDGLVDPDELKKAIRPDTFLVSIMFANNEVGTVQDMNALGTVCQEAGVPLHTDAVQAVGKLPINLSELPITYLSASAHKLHGPKGVGLTYIKRKNKPPINLIHGGHHEKRRRASTENVSGIVGFGKAMELSTADNYHREKLIALRTRLEEGILSGIPKTTLVAANAERLSNTANILFANIEGESIVMSLDFEGIAVSTGSACSSGSLEPSHVIRALGYDHGDANGSIRFSLSRYSTEEEVDYLIEKLPPIIKRLRSISAL